MPAISEFLFENIGLSLELVQAIKDLNYTEATGIQAKAIPLLMQGNDLIGRSCTGTGKTAAFGIPAVECVAGGERSAQVLVLSPTRELAMQIAQEMRKYAKYKPGVAVAAIYGGAPMEPQIHQLKTANIVIGTPGRVMDHLRRRTLRLDNLRMVILDEADEMLNMGFLEDIQTILAQTPQQRQTVLFSATMPPAILKITEEFLRDPQTVDIQSEQRTISTIEQFYYQVPQSRKMDAINLLLQMQEPRRSVIFSNTKSMVDELVCYLNDHGFKAAGLHGDMKQAGRTHVMQGFREGKNRILVATDVAARGIDVENIEAVYNFDIPQDFEYYIHRIGRTGRAGKTGASHTLVCNRHQAEIIRSLSRYINAPILEASMPTAENIQQKHLEKLSAKVAKMLSDHSFTQYENQLDQLTNTHGFALREVACALLQLQLTKDKRLIPVFKASAATHKSFQNGNRMVLHLDMGRQEGITPNDIVNAITSITNLSARAVGKIDIFDDHTLLEMRENDAAIVAQQSGNYTIKGRAVHFSPSNLTMRSSLPNARHFGGAPQMEYRGKPSREKPRRSGKSFGEKRRRSYDCP